MVTTSLTETYPYSNPDVALVIYKKKLLEKEVIYGLVAAAFFVVVAVLIGVTSAFAPYFIAAIILGAGVGTTFLSGIIFSKFKSEIDSMTDLIKEIGEVSSKNFTDEMESIKTLIDKIKTETNTYSKKNLNYEEFNALLDFKRTYIKRNMNISENHEEKKEWAEMFNALDDAQSIDLSDDEKSDFIKKLEDKHKMLETINTSSGRKKYLLTRKYFLEQKIKCIRNVEAYEVNKPFSSEKKMLDLALEILWINEILINVDTENQVPLFEKNYNFHHKNYSHEEEIAMIENKVPYCTKVSDPEQPEQKEPLNLHSVRKSTMELLQNIHFII
jgi:hypothetical protein